MGVKRFIWDEVSDNVLLETDETDTVTARYSHRPERFGELISQERAGDTSYYHYDGNHSTCNLTDKDQTVTDTVFYTAYGEEVSHTGSTTNPFGYKGAVGYYTNTSTNDIYVRNRSYQPQIGRWLSKDPLGFVDGTSLYRAYFVPGGMDPIGLDVCDCDEERGKTLGFGLPANHGWSWAHFRNWYFNSRNRAVSLKEIGLYWTFWTAPDVVAKYDKFKSRLSDYMCSVSTNSSCEKNTRDVLPLSDTDVTDVESVIFAIGSSSMKFVAECRMTAEACDGKCDCETFPFSPTDKRSYTAECTVTRSINDEFSNPLGHWGWFEFELWGGHPYGIDSCYKEVLTFTGISCDCGEKGIGRR